MREGGDSLRTPFVAGNWKMYTTVEEVQRLLEDLKRLLEPFESVDVGVCPPFPYLMTASEILQGSRIVVGAQNCHWEEQGAFTGEVSPGMLKDSGCDFVILGHSERRGLFGETDKSVRRKLKKVLEKDLRAIVCVGETLDQRESDKTETVILAQVEGCFKGLSEESMSKVTVAYEPVWAIGTGRTATPEQAQDVHRLIRSWIEQHSGTQVADHIRIQYGGSVKAGNARELMDRPDIDGALVGGASLNADDFAVIVQQAIH